jgi:flavin-dependent thymidylate synthase
MKVILSGLNLDIDTIQDLKSFVQQVCSDLETNRFNSLDPSQKSGILNRLYKDALDLLERDNLTPETLSAAYARISRNPRPVNELRQIARQEVDKARRSNQNIIFGLGHSSVAEHACFNFDIIGVSRFAVETVEHFRLASYTEKSQRYILFEDDFIIPEEIKNSNLEQPYIKLIRKQNTTYYKLYDVLKPYFLKKHIKLAEDSKNHKMIEGLAKEDARYIISLATQTQLGMTVNARTLENMIAKCNSHSLSEVRQYGKLLFEETKFYTPSIVKYVEPTKYLTEKAADLKNITDRLNTNNKSTTVTESVILTEYPKNGDDIILTTVLFKILSLDFEDCKKKMKGLTQEERKNFFRQIFHNINPWDSVIRDFEFLHFSFQLIVSASNYGQLKRHRMANIISQDYDVNLDVTIPESIIETGQKTTFMKMVEETNAFYSQLNNFNDSMGNYVLTNAHRRRVLFKINLRELYHFSRMREDQHAQWDIRETALQMSALIKDKLPLASALLAGKDRFSEVYQQLFEK